MEVQNMNEVKARFTQQIEEMSPVLSALQSLAIGKGLNESEIESIREFKSVQDYLKVPLNDAAENGLKKVFVAAVVAANQKGILPLPDGYASAESIASIVDEGLTRIKTAYQVAQGIINPVDAEGVLNDRLAIRSSAIVEMVVDKSVQKTDELINVAETQALSVSDKMVESGVERLSDIVCAAVTSAYPPAAVVTPYIKGFLPFVTPVVQTAAKKGIRMIAEVARNILKQAAPKVMNYANQTLAMIFG